MDAKPVEHDFIEIGFTNEQVEATIATEKRLGRRNRECAFLDGPVPEQVVRTKCNALNKEHLG